MFRGHLKQLSNKKKPRRFIFIPIAFLLLDIFKVLLIDDRR